MNTLDLIYEILNLSQEERANFLTELNKIQEPEVKDESKETEQKDN